MPKNPHADFTPTLAGYSGITPFRFWCQTALPLTYDDSLSYYELLNKVVNYLNHTIEDLTNVENNTSELAEAYEKLQDYVNDYFDDIDIEAELRNVLDGMAEDGTLDALLDPLVAERLPGVVENQISDVVAQQIDDAVEAQIDDVVGEQLPVLVDANIGEEVTQWLDDNVDPVGSAVTVDRSLSISGAAADAKVTGDGINGLKEHFVQLPAYTAIPKTSPLLTLSQTHGYLTPTNGIIHENAGYDIYTMDISEEAPLYLVQTSSDSRVLGIIVYNQHVDTFPENNTQAAAVYVAGYRSTEGNLPTIQNPLLVTEGQMIAIFIQQRNTGGGIVYDNDFTLYIGEYQYYLANNVSLNTHQLEQVKSKKAIIAYETPESDIGSTAREEIAVYIPATKGYIKYALVRREYSTKNYNTWQIYKAYSCDENMEIRFPITNAGEWEMAIKIQGAPDFIGGFAHGNEIVNSLSVFVNGKYVNNIASISDEEFSDVRIVMTSNLYNPNDNITLETAEQYTPVATHGREYAFTKDGLKLYQNVILNTSLTLIGSYMTMFPILRGNDTASAEQITDHYYADNNSIIYDVSVGASGGPGYGWKENVKKACIYGVTSGVFACVEMLEQPDIVNAGARLFQVEDTLNKYNKLYWSICGVGNVAYEAVSGERFATVTDYKIDVAL